MPADYVTYSKDPKAAQNFSRMRGVTDFTNAAQFNLYESGYAYLCVINTPAYIDELGRRIEDVQRLTNTFVHILENEFKGLSGIPDITADNLQVTDGINTMNVIGKVTEETAIEVTMSFTEKSGGAITKFIDYYLRGVKDPHSQATTYHGLIPDGIMTNGFENTTFTLMYIVTDSTMLNIEKAYLLCNAYPTKAQNSIYDTTKGEIDKKDIDIPWSVFLVSGEEVNKRAIQMLAYISKKGTVANVLNAIGSTAKNALNVVKRINTYAAETVELDSSNFIYDIMRDGGPVESAYKQSSTSGSNPGIGTVNGNYGVNV